MTAGHRLWSEARALLSEPPALQREQAPPSIQQRRRRGF
jgi:hypothetical protein